MKTFLAFLFSCLTLSAATTYPVLTDSTNRLFPGGVTNVFFLNSNVVTTGTMRATGVLTLTNTGNVFAGDGSRLTGISGGSSVTNFGNGANNVQATNLVVRPTPATTNWSTIIYDTNGVVRAAFNQVGTLVFPNTATSIPQLKSDTWSIADSTGGRQGMTIRNASGTVICNFSEYDGLAMANGVNIGWSSSPTATLPNTAIARNGDGLLEINNYNAGVFRDLVVRSLFATNLYATNLIINGGATVTKILSATATLNFDLTALTVEDLTITVTGAADGDVVTLGVPNGSVTTSVQYSAWVSAADTVTVRARTSAVGENPASGTFRATVIKH